MFSLEEKADVKKTAGKMDNTADPRLVNIHPARRRKPMGFG